MTKKEELAGAADVEDIFKDDSAIPESSWFKFNEPGDAIQGVLVSEPYDKEGNFGKQRVYTIQTKDGKEYLVALKYSSQERLIKQLRIADIGSELGFKFTSFYETKKGNPGKNIEVRIRGAH
jgi:hypothetical protein